MVNEGEFSGEISGVYEKRTGIVRSARLVGQYIDYSAPGSKKQISVQNSPTKKAFFEYCRHKNKKIKIENTDMWVLILLGRQHFDKDNRIFGLYIMHSENGRTVRP